MRHISNLGLQDGEDMGLDELMLDGKKYDLSQTAEELAELKK